MPNIQIRYGDTDELPGDGFRWLSQGEIMEITDVICIGGNPNNPYPMPEILLGRAWSVLSHWPTRRRIESNNIMDGF